MVNTLTSISMWPFRNTVASDRAFVYGGFVRPSEHLSPAAEGFNRKTYKVMKQTMRQTATELGRKVISKVRRNSERKQGQQFDNIMKMANDVAERNPSALHDLVNMLLRPRQAEALVGVVENAEHQAPATIVSWSFFFDDRRVTPLSYDIGVHIGPEAFEVNLAKDAIFPCPWHRQRIAGTLTSIGGRKALGQWTQDGNHQVVLWLPWGIAFVGGGNHSIAAGVVGGEGVVIPGEVLDMSEMLRVVSCDGRNYREVASQKIIAAVADERLAAVFEIGRLMQKLNVQPNLTENAILASEPR